MELCPSPKEAADKEDDNGSEFYTHRQVSDNFKKLLKIDS